MSYATLQQLIDRFGEDMLVEVTDRADPPANEIDSSVVDRAFADADALIDGYLKGRYLLPLASTPPLVCDLALAIAIYKMHRNVVSEKISDDYNAALKTLAQIAAGVVRLDVAGVEPTASGTTGVRTNDRERPLTPDSLKGWI